MPTSDICVIIAYTRIYMVWKKILFEVLKTAAMAIQHNDSAGCKSSIPSLMPYKLSAALYKYANGLLVLNS